MCYVTFGHLIRYSQTAVASFGPNKSECGRKPGGFTRLTPEVMDWVKNVTVTGTEGAVVSSGDPGESQ